MHAAFRQCFAVTEVRRVERVSPKLVYAPRSQATLVASSMHIRMRVGGFERRRLTMASKGHVDKRGRKGLRQTPHP